MEETSEITYIIKCNKCLKIASHVCINCYDFYSCSSHKEIHCETMQMALNVDLPYNQAKETKTRLQTFRRETQVKYSKLQECYLKLHNIIQREYEKCLTSLTNSLQMIETCLFSIQDDFTVIVRDPLILKMFYLNNFDQVFSKNCDESLKRFESIGKVLENFENFKSFEQNLRFSKENWNEVVSSVTKTSVDSFNDFLGLMQDGLNRVTRKMIEIHPSFMENFKFFSKLPKVCPNIYWVKAKLLSRDFDLFTGIMQNYKSLTQLEINISSPAEENFYQSLSRLSQLKLLSHLSLEGIKFDDFDQNGEKIDFSSLKILKLKNNGISSNSLISILKTFSLSSDLEYLTIQNNNLTGQNMNSLISSLEIWKNLSFFSLSLNSFDDSSSSLLQCLKNRTSLQEFHFHTNKIALNHLEKFNSGLPSLFPSRLLLSPGLHPSISTVLNSKGFTVHFQLNNTYLGS